MRSIRNRTKVHWYSLLLVTTMLLSIATVSSAAPCATAFPGVNPASTTDPQAGLTNLYTFNKPILDANSLLKYVTPVPNALTPGFIYTPNGIQNGDPLYTVSMREITQSLGVTGLNGCTGPPNTLWVYGDARDNGTTNTAPTAPHSYPGPTFEVMSNVPHRVLYTNELPNANPYYHPANIDPTLDCGPNAPGCAPYNRVVPHTHGAHVADDSDGNPDQWFTPNFAKTGHNWQPNTHIPGAVTGTYRFENSQEASTVWYHDHAMGLTHLNVFAGLAGFNIIRDANEINMQTPPAGGGAAVLPKYPFENLLAIQDRAFDTNGLQYSPDRPIQDLNAMLTNVPCDSAAGAVAPYACGALAAGTLLPNTTPCDPAAPIATATTAASPYACPVEYFTRNIDGSLNRSTPAAPITAATPGAMTFPSITSEYWGNVILVNGQVWPKQDVEKRVYRFRWLNGSDSRTYILNLVDKTTKQPIPGLDIWQIGTEQGFLPKPVKVMINDMTKITTSVVCPAGAAPETIVPNPPPVATMKAGECFNQANGIVLMPGERVDVLVDFTNVTLPTDAQGNPLPLQVILQNLGPEFPYTGEYPPSALNGQLPTAIVPEIMLLNVVPTFTATIPNTMAPAAITSLRAAPVPTITPAATRTLYLAERVDQFGRLALTINGVDYMTALNDIIPLGSVEEWDIVNLTPDGHPMHPHLIAYEVINRQDLLDAAGLPFAPPMALPLMGTTVSAQYNGLAGNPSLPTATGTIYPPAANEVGALKDTIYTPPGKVTRIKALFDIPGLYVFHCHILSHEENDMMRPIAVTTPAASVTLTASATSQQSGAIQPVTFTAAAKTGFTGATGAQAKLATLVPYSDTNAFEYSYRVTGGPAGAMLNPPDNQVFGSMSMNGVPSLYSAQGYSMVRTATWTPPTTPGSYTITVDAKAMGADPTVTGTVVTSAPLVFMVVGPSIAAATTATLPGAYKAGSSINVALSFNQTISSTAGLAITLNNGVVINTGALANVSNFSGNFTVAATGQDTPAGQFLDITGVTGTIIDANKNSVSVLSIPAGTNISNSSKIAIDTTLPTLAVAAPTAAFVNTLNQTVSGTATDPVNIQGVAINGAAATMGTGGAFNLPLTLTANAINSIAVVATDMAGNQKTANLSIQHDDTLPTVNVITPSSAYVNNATQTVSLTATDPVNIQGVTINGIAATAGAGSTYSATVNLTANAANSINIVATDRAGNQTSVTRNVTHSAVLPSVTITSPTAEYVNVLNQTINGTVTASSGIKSVTVNGVDVTTVAGAFSSSMTLTANATNTITVVATDLAGNVTTATRTIIHDNVLPVVTANPPAGLFTGSVVVNLSSKAGATIYYTTDGTTPTTKSKIYAGSITLASPATATIVLKYFAVDLAGNVGAVTTGSYALHTADLSAKIAINNGAPYTKSVNVTLAMSATDKLKVVSYAISTDNGATYLPTVKITPVVTYSAKVPVTLPSGDGNKNIYVVFTDGLGAVYPPVIASIILDSSMPVTSITPQPGNYPGGDLNLSLSTVDKSTIYYTIDGKTPTTASSKYGGKLTITGTNSTVTVKYFAVDKAGNKEAVKTAVYVFGHLADMTATVAINGGAKYTKSANVTLSFSAVDVVSNGVATMSFSNDGVKFTKPEVYASATAMPWVLDPGDGRKTVYFRFVDSAAIPNTYTYTARIVLATGVTPSTGDLDGDGKVDLKDSLKALLSSAGLVTLTPAEQARGDVGPLVAGKPQPDGVVDSGDAFLVSKKAIGLISF